MALDLVTVPCLQDNYAFLVHDPATGTTALVDAPEVAPVQAALAARGWRLTDILITHHHDDHIQAVAGLRAGARVWGNSADAHRLPPIDQPIRGGDRMTICGQPCDVIDVPGHCDGHVAFHFPQDGLLFTADSLMALGCGRLFEGTPAEAYASLMRLAALPGDPLVCSGHEYTAANARFAATLERDNPDLTLRIAKVAAARDRGEATVPSRLSEERATNPYLRAHLPALKAAVGMPDASDLEVFTEIRARKNRF
jgi:hydroxyacylglutathione hydrolase